MFKTDDTDELLKMKRVGGARPAAQINKNFWAENPV